MAGPGLSERLKDLLDETRLVMLGTQVLLGLQYRVAFAQTFSFLRPFYRIMDGFALLLILVASGLLLATPALHRIAVNGRASTFMLGRGSAHLRWALLPISVALGLDIAIGFAPVTASTWAMLAGAVFISASLGAWYGIPLFAKQSAEVQMPDEEEQPLEARLVQALTELRVILPGAQALFGFQFAAILTQAFENLPDVSKWVHLASLSAVAASVIMLMAPAAYHRLAAHGNPEERVLRYTGRMMLCSLGTLSLGMVGDAYVTVRLITEAQWLALAVALIALVGFWTMLYAIPLAERCRRAA
jgi:hypothetical protein